MKYLVESVYDKLGLIDQFADSDADLLAILNGTAEAPGLFASQGHNAEAANTISQWLEIQANSMRTVSMGDVQRRYQDIPYGWREIDIAALVARLIAQNKVVIKYGGATVNKDDRRLVDLLRKRSDIDKAVVTRREAPSESLMRQSRDFLREYLNTMDIPQGEDDLVQFIKRAFESKRDHYQKLLERYTIHVYPEKGLLTDARNSMSDVLNQSGDNVALLKHIVKHQDDLLDLEEDLENLEQFFKSQADVYDSACAEIDTLDKEADYLATDPVLEQAWQTIKTILSMDKPYTRIGELPELCRQLKDGHATLLAEKKSQIIADIEQCETDVQQFAASSGYEGSLLSDAKGYFFLKHSSAEKANLLFDLDAIQAQTQSRKEYYYNQITTAMAQPPIDDTDGCSKIAEQPLQPPKITNVARAELCPVKRLGSKAEIDTYVESIRAKLYKAMADGDGVQIG